MSIRDAETPAVGGHGGGGGDGTGEGGDSVDARGEGGSGGLEGEIVAGGGVGVDESVETVVVEGVVGGGVDGDDGTVVG